MLILACDVHYEKFDWLHYRGNYTNHHFLNPTNHCCNPYPPLYLVTKNTERISEILENEWKFELAPLYLIIGSPFSCPVTIVGVPCFVALFVLFDRSVHVAEDADE